VKLSNKGRYGVRALYDIAFHNDGRPTQIREIAEREMIPARFLEQIFQDRSGPDATASIFRDLSASIEKCFDSISIADVCERGLSLGVRRRSRERSSYVI
jgi:DNA-binding IscR family transcriptional regulator